MPTYPNGRGNRFRSGTVSRSNRTVGTTSRRAGIGIQASLRSMCPLGYMSSNLIVGTTYQSLCYNDTHKNRPHGRGTVAAVYLINIRDSVQIRSEVRKNITWKLPCKAQTRFEPLGFRKDRGALPPTSAHRGFESYRFRAIYK